MSLKYIKYTVNKRLLYCFICSNFNRLLHFSDVKPKRYLSRSHHIFKGANEIYCTVRCIYALMHILHILPTNYLVRL